MPKTALVRLAASGISVLLIVFMLFGCSAGPSALQGNRLGYNQHLHSSNNDELLINLVRIRYGEQPLFLQVGSISANFGYAASVGVNSSFIKGGGAPRVITHSPSLGYAYSENPTIIYTPVQGSQYAARMLAEIDMSTFLLLARGGWSTRLLTRLMVMRIGDLYNHMPYENTTDATENYKRFLELTEKFKELETQGELEFVRIEKQQDEVERAVIQVCFQSREEAARFGELLGTRLSPTPTRSGKLVCTIKLSPVRDLSDREDNVVYFRLRNLFEVFWALSYGIDVPAEEMNQGKALCSSLKNATGATAELDDLMPRLITIRNSAVYPRDAYIKVHTRGRWYYIEDSDLYSKLCLTALGSLYSLQAETNDGIRPMLTLPVSR